MTASDEKLSDSQHPPTEELVAYLDGELDSTAARQIEELIASDAVVRSRVDVLQHTWQMLESLEPVHASEHFTHRTLESIDALPLDEAVESAERRTSSWLPRRGEMISLCVWLICALVAAYVGTQAAALMKPPLTERDERLLREYPILKQFQELRSVPDPEFLRELKDVEFPRAEQLRGGGR